jgi:hypothetical protein
MVLHRETDLISEIRKGTLQWLGYVEKNSRWKNCDQSVQEYPVRKKVRWKAQKDMITYLLHGAESFLRS